MIAIPYTLWAQLRTGDGFGQYWPESTPLAEVVAHCKAWGLRLRWCIYSRALIIDAL